MHSALQLSARAHVVRKALEAVPRRCRETQVADDDPPACLRLKHNLNSLSCDPVSHLGETESSRGAELGLYSHLTSVDFSATSHPLSCLNEHNGVHNADPDPAGLACKLGTHLCSPIGQPLLLPRPQHAAGYRRAGREGPPGPIGGEGAGEGSLALCTGDRLLWL